MIRYEYSYYSQIRRFMQQMVKAFSGFQYKTGYRDGIQETLLVPCRMESTSRQASHILRNNSANSINTVPLITIEISDIAQKKDEATLPHHIITKTYLERKIENGKYLDEPGQKISVSLPNVHVFDITWKVNIWTSNEMQKHQLFEQIMQIINIGFDIQNSDNALDQSAFTTAIISGIQWRSRTMPFGTEDEIEVLTITFNMPFYLQPPTQSVHAKLVEQINLNISSNNPIPDEIDWPENTTSAFMPNSDFNIIVTPENYCAYLNKNNIILKNKNGQDDENLDWRELLKFYGEVFENKSQIFFALSSDFEKGPFMNGTIQFTSQKNVLYWNPDTETLPTPTLNTVDAIINPLEDFPNNNLPSPSLNQRYLILNDISPSLAWGNINAKENSIIEFNGNEWIVSFDPITSNNIQYVNTLSNRTLFFDGKEWSDLFDALYAPGFWRIKL